MGHRGEDASRAQADREHQPPWPVGGYAGHGQPESGQHDEHGQPGGYDQENGYGQPGYGQPGSGYDQGYGEGGGYPGRDAGNDWYGAQPASASGPMTAPRTGPQPRRPATGPQPGRATGPQPAPRTGPQSIPYTGPQAIPHTGQQEQYDGFDPRPGRGGGNDGSDPRRGYDPDQRAGYADDGPGVDPYRDRDSRPGRGSRGKKGGRSQPAKAKTGSAGRPRPDQPQRKRPMLLAVIAVAAVVIAGVAAYVFLFRPVTSATIPAAAGPLPTAGAAPSAQACVQQFGTYCHIAMRTDDPAALTVSELFPPAFTNDADKSSFSLVSTKLDKTCSKAVIGQALMSALKTGKCTQVVRGSYVSGNGKMMGTIGVVNLATTNQAHRAGKVVGQNDFIAPLAAAKGVAKKLGQGTGVVEAEYKGHYLILTWLEFINGAAPSTKAQARELQQFSSDLVAGTANIPLSQRMVTGTAPAPSASAS